MQQATSTRSLIVLMVLATIQAACTADASRGNTALSAAPIDVYRAVTDTLAAMAAGASANLWIVDPAFAYVYECDHSGCDLTGETEVVLPPLVHEALGHGTFRVARDSGFCEGDLHIGFTGVARLPNAQFAVAATIADLRGQDWSLREEELFIVDCRASRCSVRAVVAGAEDYELELYRRAC